MFGRSLFETFDDLFSPFGGLDAGQDSSHWREHPFDDRSRREDNVEVVDLDDDNTSGSGVPRQSERAPDYVTEPGEAPPPDSGPSSGVRSRPRAGFWDLPMGGLRGSDMFTRMPEGGMVYSSSTTTTTTNGVSETRHTERDHTGRVRSTHTRRMGDRSIEEHYRGDGEGQSVQTTNLIGMVDADRDDFNTRWEAESRRLPRQSGRPAYRSIGMGQGTGDRAERRGHGRARYS